ncbi:MAG: hypothetical protein K8H89_06890 [Flavobacteriales bacterium]|nr:hypothetical protein [Flavobacteriales bacterium]
MDRTERYDPEDLEHLMLERGFDELLEEERAYALRHLDGRAEYERMRALLHHVREEKSERPLMDADPAVRERVLAAFREQRQPQWRIWLNSVGGFLLPSRPSMYWRPALALGTVAALVFTALVTWNSLEQKDNKVLAEVKQEVPNAPQAAAKTDEEDQLEEVANTENDVEAHTGESTNASASQDADQSFRYRTPSMARTQQVEDAVDSPKEMEQVVVAEPAPPALMDATTPDVDVAQAAAGGLKKDVSGTAVTANEVASPAASRAKAEKRAEITGNSDAMAYNEGLVADERQVSSAPAYTEDDLIGLLRAAW